MQKNLLCGTVFTTFFAIPVLAFAFQCNTSQPSCSQLGYTHTKDECGKARTLKCPWGSTYYCLPEPCDAQYNYKCSAISHATTGVGESCGGKYTSCNCEDGYTWSNGICKKNDSPYILIELNSGTAAIDLVMTSGGSLVSSESFNVKDYITNDEGKYYQSRTYKVYAGATITITANACGGVTPYNWDTDALRGTVNNTSSTWTYTVTTSDVDRLKNRTISIFPNYDPYPGDGVYPTWASCIMDVGGSCDGNYNCSSCQQNNTGCWIPSPAKVYCDYWTQSPFISGNSGTICKSSYEYHLNLTNGSDTYTDVCNSVRGVHSSKPNQGNCPVNNRSYQEINAGSYTATLTNMSYNPRILEIYSPSSINSFKCFTVNGSSSYRTTPSCDVDTDLAVDENAVNWEVIGEVPVSCPTTSRSYNFEPGKTYVIRVGGNTPNGPSNCTIAN